MTKTSKVMLIFACIFTTLATILVGAQAYIELGSLNLLFGKETGLGEAIGGILLFVYSVMFGIATIVSSVIALPFDIVLLKQVGKKWYALVLFIVTLACIVTAVGLFFFLPALSEVVNNTSSSSVPSSSSY